MRRGDLRFDLFNIVFSDIAIPRALIALKKHARFYLALYAGKIPPRNTIRLDDP